MSANVSLYIAVEPAGGGEPVTVARIADRGALVSAAKAAIVESQQKTAQMQHEDVVLGELQRGESHRLQRALELIVPELCGAVQ